MPTDSTCTARSPDAIDAPAFGLGGTDISAFLRSLGWPLMYAALAIQCSSAIFFVGVLWSEILGLRRTALPWEWQESIEILASAGLILGVVTTILFLRQSLRRLEVLNRQVDIAAGNFHDHLLKNFSDWGLSPSEEAVAIFTMKGFSNNEIAEIRGTSLSTVKSQLNAVYRKSGISNRQQLISFLVEELLSGLAPSST